MRTWSLPTLRRNKRRSNFSTASRSRAASSRWAAPLDKTTSFFFHDARRCRYIVLGGLSQRGRRRSLRRVDTRLLYGQFRDSSSPVPARKEAGLVAPKGSCRCWRTECVLLPGGRRVVFGVTIRSLVSATGGRRTSGAHSTSRARWSPYVPISAFDVGAPRSSRATGLGSIRHATSSKTAALAPASPDEKKIFPEGHLQTKKNAKKIQRKH